MYKASRIKKKIQISIKNFYYKIYIYILFCHMEYLCNNSKVLSYVRILMRICIFFTLCDTSILESFNLIYSQEQLFTDSTILNMNPTGEGLSNKGQDYGGSSKYGSSNNGSSNNGSSNITTGGKDTTGINRKIMRIEGRKVE